MDMGSFFSSEALNVTSSLSSRSGPQVSSATLQNFSRGNNRGCNLRVDADVSVQYHWRERQATATAYNLQQI